MKTSKIAARLLSVVLAVMMLFSLVTVGFTASAAKAEVAETGAAPETIYLNAGVWDQAGAIFRAWVWGGSTADKWIYFTDADGDGIYEAPLGGTYTGMKILRGAPGSTEWTSWNDSGDLTIPTDGKNMYVVSDWSAGSWSTYVAPTPAVPGDASAYYLMGTLTDWATGQNMVYAEDTGVVTTTLELEAGSYTFKVKKDSNWYGAADLTLPTTIEGGTVDVADADGNAALTLDGGTYTFNYTIATKTVAIVYTAPEVEEPEATDPADPDAPVVPTFTLDWAKTRGLYAYAAVTEEVGTEAWQLWKSVSGKSYNYFYLPGSASDDEVIIYNNYTTAVTVNDVEIAAGAYATVPYEDGAEATVSGATSKNVKIMKTDAEGTVYINNAATEYEDENGNAITGTNLYSFLTGGTKNREAKGTGAVASELNGVQNAPVKKIKGRGNSTWGLDKKPFNITHDETIEIDGMKGKKWSLLANAQDSSLLRNRLVYDLANEVNMKYACDSRFVDFIVNGDYKGSYQLTQKIEMGKNTVMPDLEEPEVEDVIDEETGETIAYPKENFDFILELDTAKNAANAGDLTFTTTRGQVMTHKTPDEPAAEQVAFMKAKYQAVEDALYSDDLATLATLVDINDFARAYLVNEVAKNLDSGVTSCYFVYDSDAGIFYMSPVWDYDNALGNSENSDERKDADGNVLDLKSPAGWYAKELMHYDSNFKGGRSVFSQACYMTSKTADGKSFNDIVKDIWAADFADTAAVLAGEADAANGRLMSAEGYLESLAESGNWNYSYAGWQLSNKTNNNWISNHSSLTMYSYDAETNVLSKESKSYNQTVFADQANYAADWMLSRINWMSAQFAEAEEAPIVLPEAKDGYMRIFFENNWKWSDVKVYIFQGETVIGEEWPGAAAELFTVNDGGNEVYVAYVPDGASVIFNGTKDDGSASDQTPDITDGEDCIAYYMEWKNDANAVVSYTYYQDIRDAQNATEDEPEVPEETTAPVVEETTAPVVTDTITVYFSNAWKWTDITVYYWNADGVDNTWPGTPVEFVETNDLGQDIYKAVIPADSEGVIFAGKDNGADTQTPNITPKDGYGYYMDWNETDGNHVGEYEYAPVVPEETTVPTEPEATEPEATEPEATEPEATEPEATEPEMPTVVTVKAINSAKWAEVYAYAWDAAGNNGGEWPGTAMEKTDETVNGFDVYAISFASEYVNVIFNNNNNGSQTDNLTAMDGQYYDIKGAKWYASLADVPAVDATATDVYLVGAFNSWSTTANEFKLAEAGATTATVTMDLEAATTYEFKVVRNSAWTSNTTPITASVAGLTFSSSVSDNAKLTTTVAGTYTFTWTVAASQLTVTYPGDVVPEPTTPDEPKPDTTVKLAGSFTEWATGALEMTADETGKIFTITDVRLEAGKYEFKIVEFGTWMGNGGTIENVAADWTFRAKDADGNDVGNCTLNTKGGVYTFTFDTETDKLTVTAELDKYVFDVTWNEGNFTVNAPASIDEATDLTFTVDAAEGYKVSAVIVDMQVLTAVDGVYTIANVQGDIEILVITAEDVTVPEVMEFTVTFVDKDGNVLATETVEYGQAATAPEAPAVDGYNFTGWDTDFDFVTKDLTVKATYKKISAPIVPATTGKLRVEIAGGTYFTIAVNEGAARPQGASYMNTKMPIGATVTLVAPAVEGATFLGWMNEAGGIESTTDTFTFNTTGNDYFKAVYQTVIEGVNVVVFKNDKAKGGNGQIVDMQYYAAGDEIVFPVTPSQPGYDFTGWNMTAEEIQAALAAGQDVTVVALWERAKVYVAITANGGTITTAAQPNGQYLAYGAVTVKADAAPEGQKFAYWTDAQGNILSYSAEYKFYPAASLELTAVFVAADEVVEKKALVSVAGDPTTAGEKIAYTVSWELDASIGTITNYGILLVNANDYNEDTFYHGTTDSKIFDRAVKATNAVDTKALTLSSNQGIAYDNTYCAMAFIIYTDATTGQAVTVYSNLLETNKPAP